MVSINVGADQQVTLQSSSHGTFELEFTDNYSDTTPINENTFIRVDSGILVLKGNLHTAVINYDGGADSTIMLANTSAALVIDGAYVSNVPYGEFDSAVLAINGGDITVLNGNIDGYKRGILTLDSRDIFISGGTIRSHSGIVGITNYVGRAIRTIRSGNIFISEGNIISAHGDGIETSNSGSISISGGNILSGSRGNGIEVINSGNITFSGGQISAQERSVGGYSGIRIAEDQNQTSPSILTISGDAKILRAEKTKLPYEDAIVFHDTGMTRRNTLYLAANPNNIQGLIVSTFSNDLDSMQLQNANTLILSGEKNYSLHLTEFGTISGNSRDASVGEKKYTVLTDEAQEKRRKFFAFDTIEKNDAGTWTLTGKLEDGIITGYTDAEGKNHAGITVNAGTLALAPEAEVNVTKAFEDANTPGVLVNGGVLQMGASSVINSDVGVNKGGVIYAQAGGQQTIGSLALNGTYKIDIRAVDDYSHLHSEKTVVIDPNAKLDINATLALGGEEVFKNILTSDVAVNGIFKQENVTDNSILFDFTPWPDPNGKAIHLNAKAVPAPEPEPEPTPTPEPKPEPTPEPKPGLIEHLVKQACDDDCLAPMAASLDKIKASVDNDIAFGLMKLTSEKEVVNAVEQIQPLLGIRTSRVIMEATDTLTKAIPTGRCLTGAGDNQVWAKVLGEWNGRDGSSGLSGYQATHSGIAVGSERCVTEDTKLGLTAGYLKTDADSYDSAANHNLKADTWQVGVYGNTALTPQWDIDFYAGIGQAYLDGKRHLNFLGYTAESEMKANHFRTGITLNRAFQVNPQAKVTPFIGLDYQRVDVEDYVEKGAKDFNFAVDKQSTEAFIAKVGIKGDFQVNDRLSLQAKATVGYDMSYRGNYLRAGFVNYPKYRFTLEECDPSRVRGELDVGAKYQISQNVALGAGVQSTFAKGFNSVAGNVNLSIQF